MYLEFISSVSKTVSICIIRTDVKHGTARCLHYEHDDGESLQNASHTLHIHVANCLKHHRISSSVSRHGTREECLYAVMLLASSAET